MNMVLISGQEMSGDVLGLLCKEEWNISWLEKLARYSLNIYGPRSLFSSRKDVACASEIKDEDGNSQEGENSCGWEPRTDS